MTLEYKLYTSWEVAAFARAIKIGLFSMLWIKP
jgi:hypothetical protein